MLVLGVAAVALGMVMVSRGVLPSQSAAHSVPPTHAVPSWVERLVPASDARPAATMPDAARVPTTSAQTASSGATTGAAACTPRLDLDHDLRLVILAMARQRRRTLHPTAHFVPSDKQDVPAKYRVLAGIEETVTRAEASPQATWGPTGPSC